MSNRRRYYPQRNNDLNTILRDTLLEALGVSVSTAPAELVVPAAPAAPVAPVAPMASDDAFDQIYWFDDEPLPPPENMESAFPSYEHLEGVVFPDDPSPSETPAAQSPMPYNQFNWRTAVITREVLGPPRCRARRVR